MNHHFLKVTAIGVCVTAALVTAVLAWFAKSFEVDASADTLLMKDNKHYIVSQQAAERYDPSEFILIAFEPHDKSIFSENTLDLALELGNKIEAIDRVSRVRSIATVPIFTALNDFSANLNVDELSWQKRRFDEQFLEKALSQHPLYEGLLINKEHSALGLQVVFTTPKELQELQSRIVEIQSRMLDGELSDEDRKALDRLKIERAKLGKSLDEKRIAEIDQIREIVREYEKQGNFYLGGNNLLAYQLIKIIKSDLLIFGALIVIIVSLVIFALFRQFRWVLLSLISSAVSVVCTLGLLSVFGLKVTVISANVVALQIILTLALIIHLIVQYQELIPTIEDRTERIWATIKLKVKPCIYAGLTTAIGFGSLIFSGVQPVISFGWMMVVAMLVTIVVSLSVFPAMLLVFFSPSNDVKRHKHIEQFMTSLARLVANRASWVVATSVVVVIVGIAGSLRLTAENSFLNYFKESTEVHRELTFIDQKFGGSTPLEVLYRPSQTRTSPDLVLTAEAEQKLRELQEALEQIKSVGAATSVADFTRIAHAVAGKPLTEYELTAFYKALDQRTKDDFFKAYFNEEAYELRIGARIKDSTEGLDRAELMAAIKADIASMGIDESDYTLTGLFVLYQDILERLVKSQFYTLGIVYLAMAVVLWLVFRSLRVAIIALVPNVITTACVLGVMGLAGIALDLMTLTIAAVAMGISVDDTIHYIHRYLSEIKNKTEDAVLSTNISVGYALLYTTMIIVCGFASLVLSEFVPSILFGVLTSLAMVVALMTDITVLPVLLKRYLK